MILSKNIDTLDLTISLNSDFNLQLELQNEDLTDFDLTGQDVYLQIKKSPNSSSLLDLSTINGKIITTGNSIIIKVQKDELQLLPYVENAQYDILLSGASSTIKILEGNITFEKGITLC
jgi:hypothetical protein